MYIKYARQRLYRIYCGCYKLNLYDLRNYKLYKFLYIRISCITMSTNTTTTTTINKIYDEYIKQNKYFVFYIDIGRRGFINTQHFHIFSYV